MLNKVFIVLTAAVAAVAVVLTTQAEPENGHEHNHDMHMQHQSGGAAMSDSRTLVHFPDNLRIHTLANMRDHLQALGEIQTALANGAFDKAGEIAERRLGMTSLKLHGAHEVAPYMPKAMQDMGTAMHHAASRFAIAASNAAVSGDVKPALAALSEVTQSCVACHSKFRLQ
jgi:hypothetical protein